MICHLEKRRKPSQALGWCLFCSPIPDYRFFHQLFAHKCVLYPSSRHFPVSIFTLVLLVCTTFFGPSALYCFSAYLLHLSFSPHCKRMALLLHVLFPRYLNILLFYFSPFRWSYSLSTFSSRCTPLKCSEIAFINMTELGVESPKRLLIRYVSAQNFINA